MQLIEKSWLPACTMKRVIVHWTVGRYQATEFEREHYHILVEGDGKLVRGIRSIADNVSTTDDIYAAHTKGANTGAIGVCACCMLGCQEKPFVAGSQPMTLKQWRTMARVVAELCQHYKIPVTRETVLGHGEVQTNLGITQSGKWDPMVLPWDTSLTYAQVGDFFRARVRRIMEEGDDEDEKEDPLVLVAAKVLGKKFSSAILYNGSSYVRIWDVAKGLGWNISEGESGQLKIKIRALKTITVAYQHIQGKDYVSAKRLAEALGKTVGWDSKTRTITVE
jgi:hypothetical protein